MPSASRPISQTVALCAAMPIAEGAGVIPEWVHLLPAGGVIRTNDGRGPYLVPSLQAVATRLKAGDKLPIDECHSTDRAAPRGEPAPARGWIVALQARDDGLWGKVEWTGEGRRLMEDGAYRGLSPAILHDRKNNVLAVLRASLINTPNLLGLVALHSEESGMDFKAKLIELLGLDGDTEDEAVIAALSAKLEGGGKTALQSELGSDVVVALQSELADMTGKFNDLQEQIGRDKAIAYVDGEIAAGRVGLKPLREEYISLHTANPDQAKKLIGGMPVLHGSTRTGDVPVLAADLDESGLDAGDRQVMALMGISEEDYLASQKAAGVKKEVL